MRKKIFLLLVFLVSFMGFGIDVRAEAVDYSLLYDVTSFDISETQIGIKGFAVRHNFNNDNPKINIFFEDSSGNRVVDFDVSKTNDSLYDWYCQRNRDNTCNGYFSYRYDGVVFDAKLNLSDFSNSSVFKYNTNYTLKIQVCLRNDGCSIVEELGVPKGVVSGKNKDIEITNSTDRMTIYTSSSRLLSSNWGFGTIQDGDVYWEQNSSYKILSVIKGGSSCTSGATKYSYCPNLYELSYKHIYGDCVRKGISGFASPGDQCSAYASAAWVKPNGRVTIKFNGSSDHVCNISNGTLNACTGGSIENNCSKMTVYDDEKNISAVVSIKESSNITPGEDADYIDNYNSYFGIDYSKYNIVKGKTFHYALTYTNTASWSIVERNYGNLSQSEGDQAISAKMRNYYNEIGNNFVVNVSIKSNDIEKFNTAGTWDCTGGKKDEFVNDNKTTTLICKYNLKYLYIDGNGEDTYGDILENSNGDELTLGRNFYIPLSYKKDKFTWEVNSSSSLNTVKVRTNKDVKTPNSYLLAIDIISSSSSDDNNQCSIKIVDSNDVPDGNYSGDSSGDPGYNSNSEYVDDKLYVYRTVDVNNPFPDGYIPKNWNNKDFIKRLKSSYDNLQKPDYETVPMTAEIINNVRRIDTVYISWEDTITSGSDNSGSNNFVGNATYFNTIYSGKHCKFGLYNSKCDGRVW